MPKTHAHGGGSDRGAPKKGRSAKYYKWCKNANGPYTTHNTTKCCRFEKDGTPKDKPVKPFDSAKKPWKKTGSGDSSQMAYLTEKMAKLKKKLKKTKKHGKKRARDSSDSDSDSDYDSWSGSIGSQVDKHLKLEQPTGIDLKATDTRPIKATKLALDVIRANEIAIENSKTGKVTAVVAIIKVFGDKSNSGNSKLLIKPNKWLNSKKKDLNQSKKHLNGLSKPVSDVSERLLVKQKTIRVLLDTGLSGDLLFIKKGSQKYIPTVKRPVPQSWGTSNGTFQTKKVGTIDISFMEHSASKSVHLTPDIVQYKVGAPSPLYDLIIGKQTLHDRCSPGLQRKDHYHR